MLSADVVSLVLSTVAVCFAFLALSEVPIIFPATMLLVWNAALATRPNTSPRQAVLTHLGVPFLFFL